MECACIRYMDLPHTTKLFADFVYHFDRVRSFYPYSPHDPGSYEAAAREISFPPERRAALVSALREQNQNEQALEKLGRPETVAVVTGQQVGLFSGPAYTIYKALTAVKLARELSARGIPAVPMFWLATEDHDLAEVNHTWVFDSANHPVKLQSEGALSSSRPVGDVEITGDAVSGLREALSELPFGEEVTVLVADAYQPGSTFGGAFRKLLERLLPDYGLLYVDPMLPAMRKLTAETIRAALQAAPELARALLERSQELAAAGYHAQVHFEDHTSLVFLLENGRRVALRRDERGYSAAGRRFSTEELAGRAEQLSPNALLRPVVQDTLLPTVAYVGGPAELAYLAQSGVIYRAILGRMPVALHRSGFTILDRRSQKLIARYGLSLTDFFHGDEVLKERIASKLIPAGLNRVMQETRSEAGRAIERLHAELSGFDSTLASALSNSRRKIEHQFSRIEGKVARQMLVRDSKATGDSAYLSQLVFPLKHLQERLYSILPFLARHGLDLIPQTYENVRLECPDHQLLTA